MAVQQPQILLLLVEDIRIQRLDKITTTTVEQDESLLLLAQELTGGDAMYQVISHL